MSLNIYTHKKFYIAKILIRNSRYNLVKANTFQFSEQLLEEWSTKLKEVESEAATAADEARRALETTRSKLIADRVDQLNKLKEKHRKEMGRDSL